MSSSDSPIIPPSSGPAPIDFAPPAGAPEPGYAPAPPASGPIQETTPSYVSQPVNPYSPPEPVNPYPPAPYPSGDNNPVSYPPPPAGGYIPAPGGYGQSAPAAYPPVAGYGQPAVYDSGYPQQYGAYPIQEYPEYPPASDLYATPYAPPYVIGNNSTEKNSLGIASLVLGIVSFFCVGLFAGVIAIILGAQGRKAADEGRATNKSMATAGMILGIIGTVIVGLYWILLMLPSY